jgi:hypothetical protein
MKTQLTLLGDINLMGVPESSRPFAQIAARMNAADIVFANLECCFFDKQSERSMHAEGSNASPEMCRALVDVGVHADGNANNVNYGASAIRSSLACLQDNAIGFTGAGGRRQEAHQPVIIERNGVRFGRRGHSRRRRVAGSYRLPAATGGFKKPDAARQSAGSVDLG